MASTPSLPLTDSTQVDASAAEHEGKYLLVMAAAASACLGGMILVNIVVDPLWYFKGNTLTGMNFVLDERTSKPTRLARLDKKPDCLLIGTSSGSLMNDTTAIVGGDCFNLAISKGRSDEFVKFAEWAKSQGIEPRTVIFELDAVNMVPVPPSVTLPDFVVNKEAPPSPFLEYASFGALVMSAKTILKLQSNPRYYDRQFRGAVVKTPPYDPTVEHGFMGALGPYESKGSVEAIRTFRSNWPGVKVICYAATYSPDFTDAIDRKGTLPSFVGALSEISKHCDSFRDFNIPSDLSADPLLTYDGIHYTPETNARFAAAFSGSKEMAWTDVSGLSPEQYIKTYRAALARVEAKAEKSFVKAK